MITKEEKTKMIEQYAQVSGDTGSIFVQIALLTQRITLLTAHCKEHSKDFSTRRGLLRMVCRRRKYLDYLADTNQAQYQDIIQKLGLRK
jgi:small subunit ribosomal protein S15